MGGRLASGRPAVCASARVPVPGAEGCMSVYASEITQLPGGPCDAQASLGLYFILFFFFFLRLANRKYSGCCRIKEMIL